MPLLINVAGLKPGEKNRFLFGKSPVRFGRNELNELIIDSTSVSRFHAIIHFDEYSIEYKDLASTNGTVRNGERLPPREPIKVQPRDKLIVGPLALTFDHTEETAPSRGQKREVGQSTVIDVNATENLRLTQVAMTTLQPIYQAMQKEWQSFDKALRSVVEGRSPQLQSMLLAAIEEQYPGIKDQHDYRVFKTALKLPDLDDAPAEIADGDALARALHLPPGTNQGQLLLALSEILPAFCASFVELRRGFDQFGAELAINLFEESTPLTTAETAQDVLQYLITSEPGETSRVRELNGSFADMMIHQVALISGVMEGVRGVLQRFSPAAIGQSLAKKKVSVGPFKIGKGFWPLSVSALWKRFTEIHQSLMEDEQALNQVLFGRDFARSYDAARSRKDPETTAPVRQDTNPVARPPKPRSARP